MSTFGDMPVTTESELLRELEVCLKHPGLAIISCDVFDTLIFRAAGTPEQFWLSLARQAHQQGLWPDDDLWTFVALRKAAEERAREVSMKRYHHQEVMLADIYACWPSAASDKLLALENDLEYKNWRLNRSLIALLLQYVDPDRELILVSDMYLQSELILRFFHENEPGLSISAIYVSGERGLSKRRGDIFPYIMNHLSVPADSILHIGDDKIADEQMAIAAGVRYFHSSLGDDYVSQIRYEQRLCSLQIHELEYLRKLWIWNTKDNSLFSRLGGLIYGPVLFSFARWVVIRCQQLGVQKIFCLLREGEIISNLIKLVPGHNLVVKTLAVSRRSSFLPSQNKWSPEILHTLAQRRGYTLGELFEDVGLDAPKKWLTIMSQTLAELIELPLWSDIYSWIICKQIDIENHLQKQRVWLQAYLEQQGVDNSSETAILDWGCGGSLLFNLCNVATLDHVNYFMFYSNRRALKFSLSQHLNVFQPGSSSPWSDVIANSPELSEILLNGLLSSTRSYKFKNEKILPIAVRKPVFKVGLRRDFERFHDAVLLFSHLAKNNNWLSNGINVLERKYLFGILYRLVQYPTWLEATMLKSLPVPLSGGQCAFLIDDAHVSGLLSITNSGVRAFDIGCEGVFPLVRNCWWYPGVVALAFPGQLQSIGEMMSSQDDEKVGPYLLQQLQQHGIKETALYGAGELGSSVYKLLVNHGIRINCVIDRRAITTNFKLAGHDVITLEKAKLQNIKCFVVASRAYAYEIVSYIKSEYTASEDFRVFSYLSIRI
ncbi:hypothetical protein ACSZNN_14175 [Aeromonas hydrophila]